MPERRYVYIILAVIIFTAICLRLYPVQANLPQTYWHDENNYIDDAMRMGKGSFAPSAYSHGGFYQLVLFIAYGAYYLFLHIAGAVKSPSAFLIEFLRDPSVFFIIGRVISALCGSALIYISYAISARIFSARAGLISAIFTGFSLLMFQMSIFALADMLAVLMLAAAFLCIILSVKSAGDRRLYYAACLLVGLAAASKIHCSFGVAFLSAAAIIKYRQGPRRAGSLIGMLLAGTAFTALGFFIGIPSAIFNIGAVYNDTVVRIGTPHILMNPHKHKWLFYFTNHMRNGWGVPLEVLSLCGMGYALYRRTAWDILLVAFPIAQYLLFMNTTGFAYHIIPMTFFVFILAARLLDDIIGRTPLKSSIAFAILAAALIIYPSFIDSIRLIRVVMSPDTRTVAKSWIEHSIEPGSKILEEGCLFGTAINAPQLSSTPASVKRDLDETVSSGGSGFLKKIRMMHGDEIYGKSPLYDIVKVDKLKAEDLAATDPSFVIVTSNNDETLISAELRYFVEAGYGQMRDSAKSALLKKYALKKSFIPTVWITVFFPHLMDKDYRTLRALDSQGPKEMIRGPQIDIYERRP